MGTKSGQLEALRTSLEAPGLKPGVVDHLIPPYKNLEKTKLLYNKIYF